MGQAWSPFMSSALCFPKVIVGGSPAAPLLEGRPAERRLGLGLGLSLRGLHLQVEPCLVPLCRLVMAPNICFIRPLQNRFSHDVSVLRFAHFLEISKWSCQPECRGLSCQPSVAAYPSDPRLVQSTKDAVVMCDHGHQVCPALASHCCYEISVSDGRHRAGVGRLPHCSPVSCSRHILAIVLCSVELQSWARVPPSGPASLEKLRRCQQIGLRALTVVSAASQDTSDL